MRRSRAVRSSALHPAPARLCAPKTATSRPSRPVREAAASNRFNTASGIAAGPANIGTTITFDHPVSSFSFYYDVALFPEKFNAWADGLDTGSCVLCNVTLAINTDGTAAGATGPSFYSSGPLATPIQSIRLFQGDLTIDNFSFTPVPEPSTLALVGVGFAGVGWFARRRFRRK